MVVFYVSLESIKYTNYDISENGYFVLTLRKHNLHRSQYFIFRTLYCMQWYLLLHEGNVFRYICETSLTCRVAINIFSV